MAGPVHESETCSWNLLSNLTVSESSSILVLHDFVISFLADWSKNPNGFFFFCFFVLFCFVLQVCGFLCSLNGMFRLMFCFLGVFLVA